MYCLRKSDLEAVLSYLGNERRVEFIQSLVRRGVRSNYHSNVLAAEAANSGLDARARRNSALRLGRNTGRLGGLSYPMPGGRGRDTSDAGNVQRDPSQPVVAVSGSSIR